MPSRKTRLKETADDLFRQQVRSRGRCEAQLAGCSETRHLQCAHIFRRGYYETRWDSENAVCLCLFCHNWFTSHPDDWDLWCRQKFGEEFMDRLYERSRLHVHVTEAYLEEVIDRLRT